MNTITIYPDKCKIKKMSGESTSVILEVDYEYYYEEGQDPTEYNETGTPPYKSIEIINIQCSGDLHSLLCWYSKTKDIIDEIELKISEYERDNK